MTALNSTELSPGQLPNPLPPEHSGLSAPVPTYRMPSSLQALSLTTLWAGPLVAPSLTCTGGMLYTRLLQQGRSN